MVTRRLALVMIIGALLLGDYLAVRFISRTWSVGHGCLEPLIASLSMTEAGLVERVSARTLISCCMRCRNMTALTWKCIISDASLLENILVRMRCRSMEFSKIAPICSFFVFFSNKRCGKDILFEESSRHHVI